MFQLVAEFVGQVVCAVVPPVTISTSMKCDLQFSIQLVDEQLVWQRVEQLHLSLLVMFPSATIDVSDQR